MKGMNVFIPIKRSWEVIKVKCAMKGPVYRRLGTMVSWERNPFVQYSCYLEAMDRWRMHEKTKSVQNSDGYKLLIYSTTIDSMIL